MVLNMKDAKNVIGALAGDIIGSKYEFHNHRSTEFPLFAPDCEATDDSVMTVAIMKALIDSDGDDGKLYECAVSAMREIGRNYPSCGYGGRFQLWMFSSEPKPYNSFGNGAAMRVSPVAYVSRSIEEARRKADLVTSPTHNHPEGIKGAEVTAAAVYMALHGFSKGKILSLAGKYYALDFNTDEIRQTYKFDETCAGTIPQALVCFREAGSYEEAVRLAVSIGGDSDTLAAIAGSIAGAYYGVPDKIATKAFAYLDERLFGICMRFVDYVQQWNESSKN